MNIAHEALMTVQPALMAAWWCRQPSLEVASTRIRGAQVQKGLREFGIDARWYAPREAERYAAIVISKRQDQETLDAAWAHKRRGQRIVLDFCDNLFLPADERPRSRAKVEVLRHLTALADAVVAATPTLAEILRQECRDAPEPVVIGDLADDLSIVPLPWWKRPWIDLKRRRELARLDAVAQRGVARLVWFGHHGGKRRRSGLTDLARLSPMLEALHRERPIHLTVISDSASRFRETVGSARYPKHYVPWDPWTFGPLLERQEIALIPAASNTYTDCKTDNRVVKALGAGLAVVADAVPSYRKFAGHVALGDFEGSIRRYLDAPELRRADVAAALGIAQQSCQSEPLLSAWARVLRG
jgi:hypothetical protein